jgi:hypothetical protein
VQVHRDGAPLWRLRLAVAAAAKAAEAAEAAAEEPAGATDGTEWHVA